MKTLLCVLGFLAGNILQLNAQNSIEVEITNFKSNQGIAIVRIFNSETTFMEDVFIEKEAEIRENSAIARFRGIPDGIYAIFVYHDENSNGALDKFLGIPTEDYGASNEAHSRLGSPSWKESLFEVRDGRTVKQEIRL